MVQTCSPTPSLSGQGMTEGDAHQRWHGSGRRIHPPITAPLLEWHSLPRWVCSLRLWVRACKSGALTEATAASRCFHSNVFIASVLSTATLACSRPKQLFRRPSVEASGDEEVKQVVIPNSSRACKQPPAGHSRFSRKKGVEGKSSSQQRLVERYRQQFKRRLQEYESNYENERCATAGARGVFPWASAVSEGSDCPCVCACGSAWVFCVRMCVSEWVYTCLAVRQGIPVHGGVWVCTCGRTDQIVSVDNAHVSELPAALGPTTSISLPCGPPDVGAPPPPRLPPSTGLRPTHPTAPVLAPRR